MFPPSTVVCQWDLPMKSPKHCTSRTPACTIFSHHRKGAVRDWLQLAATQTVQHGVVKEQITWKNTHLNKLLQLFQLLSKWADKDLAKTALNEHRFSYETTREIIAILSVSVKRLGWYAALLHDGLVIIIHPEQLLRQRLRLFLRKLRSLLNSRMLNPGEAMQLCGYWSFQSFVSS